MRYDSHTYGRSECNDMRPASAGRWYNMRHWVCSRDMQLMFLVEVYRHCIGESCEQDVVYMYVSTLAIVAIFYYTYIPLEVVMVIGIR